MTHRTPGPPYRSTRVDRLGAGRAVAVRAVAQIRLVAVALLLVVGAGHRGDARVAGLAVPSVALAGAAAVVLLLVAGLSTQASRVGRGHRSVLAGLATVLDAAVVLGVVWLAGLPPASLALVLLMLPLLEAALWFGLPGLAGLWAGCSAALGVGVVLDLGGVPADALRTLAVALPTLLLATIPVAVLAEHLVGQVAGLAAARTVADDRARLLGQLSAVTADLIALDADAVLGQLAQGAVRLGAVGARVVAPAGDAGPALTVAEAGDADALDAPGTAGRGPVDPAGDRRVVVTRDLTAPGADPRTFSTALVGPRDEVSRRAEAIDLLVDQAVVALANAALVTQLETLKRTYQEQATRDQLTGLANRRGLVLQARALVGRRSVLFCDLDGFKGVNDGLGHAAGDELLEQVARRLERVVGTSGALGRLGGDEFVVVLAGAPEGAAAELGHRVQTELGRPFLLAAGMARIGVSIGTADAHGDGEDLEQVLTRADQLMYEVKRHRKAGGARDELTGAQA
jgi:diguanylate cyclase (GGDEF)-like protein